jgi:hypothetical protein
MVSRQVKQLRTHSDDEKRLSGLGDVTGSGIGSFATIATDSVMLPEIQIIAMASVSDRNTAGTGDPEVLTTLPN